MNEEEKILLLNYLKGEQPFEFQRTQRNSTLIAGLRACRICTNRNGETGIYIPAPDRSPGNWLGAIGYFSILDQIGSCFRLASSQNPSTNNNIKNAIKEFGYDLIDNDGSKLDALIALRNSFTHDFNLLNIPSNINKTSEIHKFTVIAEPDENWIVKLPQRQWNMDIRGKNFNDTSDTTYVNLFMFGELVEKVYKKIYQLAESGRIEPKMEITELINKYTFVTSYNPSIPRVASSSTRPVSGTGF